MFHSTTSGKNWRPSFLNRDRNEEHPAEEQIHTPPAFLGDVSVFTQKKAVQPTQDSSAQSEQIHTRPAFLDNVPAQMQAEEEELQAKENPAQMQEEEDVQMKEAPAQMVEEEELQAKIDTTQLAEEDEELQMKGAPVQSAKDEELMQGKAVQKKSPAQLKKNGSKSGMPSNVQAKMEGSFGTDFSNVNIHANDGSATQMGALAYTQGNDVHFAPGQYNPSSSKGQELLGHELTHVVQQRQGRVAPTKQGKGMPVNDNPSLEKEADDMGKRAAQGKTTSFIEFSGNVETTTTRQSKLIQAKSINDYSDPLNTAFDPSKISDTDIQDTDEYKYLVSNYVKVPYRFSLADALLATRLALRQIRDGGTFDVATNGMDILHQANKQLEVLEKSESYKNKLEWSQQGMGLQGSEFGRWLLGGGSEPNESSGIMNCWELVLFSAYKCGLVSQSKLQGIYTTFNSTVGSSPTNTSIAAANTYFEGAITSGSEKIYIPGDPDSPAPLPGDIVFFNTLIAHTAIAIGKNTTTGKVDVMSLWTPNSKKTEHTTIEQLLTIASGPVRFYTSNW